MAKPSQPAILLLSADRREVRRWVAALEPVSAQVWCSPDDLPPEDALVAHPLVVVTDGPGGLVLPPRLKKLDSIEHGLVRLGSGDSSDVFLALGKLDEPATARSEIEVELPIDVSARELALVCRLLGEIVLLRRALRKVGHESERLREQAHTDPLTGLPNRRAWDEALARLFSLAADERLPWVLASFDLDHFKLVNDRGGHLLGDAVLRVAGQAIAASIRRHDFAARLGGDEFGLILTQLSPESVRTVIERLRAEIARATREVTTPCVTASVGYAVVATRLGESSTSGGAEAWFEAAGTALRQAKLAGRDRAVAAQLAEP